jgi:ankyrin repeat protein
MARRNNNRQHVSLLMYNSSEGISAPLREFIEGLLEGDVSKVAKHVRSRRKSNDSSSAKIALDQPVLENLLPLFLACQGKTHEHATVVRHLIKRGSKTRDSRNRTPLHQACEVNSPIVLKVLLTLLPTDANFAAFDRSTPLAIAAQCGSVDCCELLLKFGVAVNDRTIELATPLLLAVTSGHADVVKVLLTKDARTDASLPSEQGATPLFVAAQKDVGSSSMELCALLLKYGDLSAPSVNATVGPNGGGPTALMMAAKRQGSLDVVKMLVLQGHANVNQADCEGRTPLYVACGAGCLDNVQFLLDNAAEIEPEMASGSSPLFIACYQGHTDVATLLISHGADAFKRDAHGKTIFEVACGGDSPHVADILRLLIKAGARERRWREPVWLHKQESAASKWSDRETEAMRSRHAALLKATKESVAQQRVAMLDAFHLCRKAEETAGHAYETARRARFGLGDVELEN